MTLSDHPRSRGVYCQFGEGGDDPFAGAAVLGHPAASIAMLANMLAERGEYLPAGSFVMIGAITAAVQVEKGDSFCVHFQDLGSISGRFE